MMRQCVVDNALAVTTDGQCVVDNALVVTNDGAMSCRQCSGCEQ